MLRKRRAKDDDHLTPTSTVASTTAPAPVNVVVIVESGRKRRPHAADQEENEGHPILKTMLGLAVAKRLTRRRRRPFSKRVKKAVREGRRKVKKTTHKVRRALR